MTRTGLLGVLLGRPFTAASPNRDKIMSRYCSVGMPSWQIGTVPGEMDSHSWDLLRFDRGAPVLPCSRPRKIPLIVQSLTSLIGEENQLS